MVRLNPCHLHERCPLSDVLVPHLQEVLRKEPAPRAVLDHLAQATEPHLKLCTEWDGQEQAARIQCLESRNAELQQELASQATRHAAELATWQALQAELTARECEYAAAVRALQDSHVDQLATQLVECALAQAQCSGLQSSLRCATDALLESRGAGDAALSASAIAGKAGDGTAGHDKALPTVRFTFGSLFPWRSRKVDRDTLVMSVGASVLVCPHGATSPAEGAILHLPGPSAMVGRHCAGVRRSARGGRAERHLLCANVCVWQSPVPSHEHARAQ
jgi:hypothetical protein